MARVIVDLSTFQEETMPVITWDHTKRCTMLQFGSDFTWFISPQQLSFVESRLSDAIVSRAEYDGKLEPVDAAV